MNLLYDQILVIPKIGGTNVEASKKLASKIVNSVLLKNCGIKVITSEKDINLKTLIVPIGGDGTVLHAAKIAAKHDCPILGINLGTIGFLTELDMEMPITALSTINDNDINNGIWLNEERILLTIKTTNNDVSNFVAFNDIVISDIFSKNIIKYDMYIGKTLNFAGSHRANSVIIGTPTGSTAYSLFAGGSIIAPTLDVISITPVAAMSISSRSVIVNGDDSIIIEIAHPKTVDNESNLCVTIDGQAISGSDLMPFISSSDTENIYYKIKIVKHYKKITMLHSADYNFFTRLSKKLNWNT